MQKRPTTSYDDTKKMLNTLRRLNESISSKPLTEQMDPQSQEDNSGDPNEQSKDAIEVINGVDVRIISTDENDLKLLDNQKNAISSLIDSFREQISELSKFEPGFTINENQIRLDGSIPDMDINFVLIAGNESGFYVNADMLKLTNENMIVLDKLVKFELTFKDSMEPLITDRSNN
jgi:hypothetical protein